ncbi:MAG: hypothetical protein LC723_05325 [Actinobacteria bacterium]|nr:hypothetical protein [Actinomycetota bacterium]
MALVRYAIEYQWPGVRFIPVRGQVVVPPVRKGGTTDTLIELAVSVAEAYYGNKEQILRRIAAQTDKPYGLVLAEIRAQLGVGEPQ